MLFRLGEFGEQRQVRLRQFLRRPGQVEVAIRRRRTTVITALASFIALIFSGISLYQTVLKRAEIRVFVPETVSYTRDPNGSFEVLAVPVTAWVVFSEFSDNRNMRFIAAACIGIGLMISTIAVPVFEPYETIITVIGGTLLAGAHLWRWFRNKSHSENENSGGASV